MSRAGFAKIEITPPMGTRIAGKLIEVRSAVVLDPLYARIAVLDCGVQAVAVIQLDTLSVRWTQVNDIRRRIQSRYGFDAGSVLVAATHTHSGPAVTTLAGCPRDDKYIEFMVQRVVEGFGAALNNRVPAEIGFARGYDFTLSYNRRVIQRDGTMVTQGNFKQQDALCVEGPIDPAITVLAARGRDGKLLGSIVHFTGHPVGFDSDKTAITAGHPGVLARILEQRGCPEMVYLNGCLANINCGFRDPLGGATREHIGSALAEQVTKILATMEWREIESLDAVSKTIELPYRKITQADLNGTARGTQRYASQELYQEVFKRVVEKMKRGTNKAEVQTLFINDIALVGIPAEYFVEYGLRICETAWPTQAVVVGLANGMVGYVPTPEAFRRGGYETTFADSSRLAPEAGEMLFDAAISLLKKQPTLQTTNKEQ